MTAFTIAVLVTATLGIIYNLRRHWLSWRIEEYHLCALAWGTRTQQTGETGELMAELWPDSYMQWDLLHWDFRRYIVNQDLYDEMVTWARIECAKETDVDLSKVFQSPPPDSDEPVAPSDNDETPPHVD